MDKEQILQFIEEKLQENYRSGNPQIPPHQHNGIDNLQINASNIIGLSSGGINGFQVFTSSGTFSVPSGYTKFLVQAVGAGAGGGSTSTSGTTAIGGGAGAYCQSLVNLTGISTVTVTIGTGGTGHSNASAGNGNDGGDTTFGSYFTAGKGLGSGVGGTASGANLNINGGNAGQSYPLFYGAGSTTNYNTVSQMGGISFFGHGTVGATGSIGSQQDGQSALFYGDGASGGASGTSGGVTAGGNGKSGLLIITW